MTTQIEWCDETWNPITGCTKVSDGCRFCYAERVSKRFGTDFNRIAIHPDRFHAPLRWRKPRRVFVNSMSDLFHEEVGVADITRLFEVMAAAAQHQFLILTKRAERMLMLRGDLPPLPNVWLGVSVENQSAANNRVPPLLATPAAVRFVSYEPALEPVDLSPWLHHREIPSKTAAKVTDCRTLDWVICGGESGPNFRPMHPDSARRVRDQCAAAGVPFFFKQWGGRRPKSGGRLLDGREHNEYPEGSRK